MISLAGTLLFRRRRPWAFMAAFTFTLDFDPLGARSCTPYALLFTTTLSVGFLLDFFFDGT
jgi:hypothetical protein